MSSPLPHRPSIDHSPCPQRSIALGDERSAAVFDALASEIPRAIVMALSEGPAPASVLADRVDTSVQNAQYHLEKLCDAGLVCRPGTWYSEKGTSMTVYALAFERLELHFTPSDSPAERESSRNASRPAPTVESD